MTVQEVVVAPPPPSPTPSSPVAAAEAAGISAVVIILIAAGGVVAVIVAGLALRYVMKPKKGPAASQGGPVFQDATNAGRKDDKGRDVLQNI